MNCKSHQILSNEVPPGAGAGANTGAGAGVTRGTGCHARPCQAVPAPAARATCVGTARLGAAGVAWLRLAEPGLYILFGGKTEQCRDSLLDHIGLWPRRMRRKAFAGSWMKSQVT